MRFDLQEDVEKPNPSTFMKRYFSAMVDMYPEEAGDFITAREEAKKASRAYEDAIRLMEDTSAKLFNVNCEEQIVHKSTIDALPNSNASSPEK